MQRRTGPPFNYTFRHEKWSVVWLILPCYGKMYCAVQIIFIVLYITSFVVDLTESNFIDHTVPNFTSNMVQMKNDHNSLCVCMSCC